MKKIQQLISVILLFLPVSLLWSQTPIMKNIPSGWFEMGCTSEQSNAYTCNTVEFPVHSVYLYPFEMSRTEITQAQFAEMVTEVTADNAYCQGPNKPMNMINLFDCLTYCNRLSVSQGFRPAYYLDPEFTQPFDTITNNSLEFFWDLSANGYRLPTEAEWEYAARANSNSVYAGSNTVGNVAWYSTNTVTPFGCRDVGLKSSNGFGLKDMSGNIAERCWDLSGSYSSSDQVLPIGPSSNWQGLRINRGGSFVSLASNVRVANRFDTVMGYRDMAKGFRVARGAYSIACDVDLVTPIHGSTDVPDCTIIKWTKSLNVINGYKLYIGTQSNNYDLVNGEIVKDTTYFLSENLPKSDTIFLRIIPFTSSFSAEGCQEFFFITSSQSTIPKLSISTPEQDSVCTGFLQSVSIIGDTTLMSFWSNGDTSATTIIEGYGSHSLTWEQEGCYLHDTVFIAQAKYIMYYATVTNTIPDQSTGSIELDITQGKPPFEFNWEYESSFYSTDKDIYNLASGYYSVSIAGALNCKTTAHYYEIYPDSTLVSSTDLHINHSIHISPNPSNGQQIQLESKTNLMDVSDVELVNSSGKKIFTKKIHLPSNSKRIMLNFDEILGHRLPNGIYFVKVRNEKYLKVVKLVIAN